ncbi:MAG: S8 family peptidase [Vicinamibacterales bacterium]
MERQKVVTGKGRFILAAITALAVITVPSIAIADAQGKLGKELNDRGTRAGWSRVIVTLHGSADVSSEVLRLGGNLGRRLSLINGQVVELPNGLLKQLARHPAVLRLDEDRATFSVMSRVAVLSGARAVQRTMGYDGAGVGVAVIDSGFTSWHDDLTYGGSNASVQVNGNQRVAGFVDFVNGATLPYDDNGHGTHVSGIIAGNGYDSNGRHAGMAPAAHIVSLKVLDGNGVGVISDVIAAFEYAVANRVQHNIRVVNLSVGAAVISSYNTDPLTLAAKRVVDAGIVVVTAAGNRGLNSLGQPQWGGILAPGNAPWVLTVGASTHQGTLNRTDDAVTGFSSSGPSAIDFAAKPDIVASGMGTVSLSAPGSLFYTTKAAYLVAGTLDTAYMPYLSLSGTSMAAPVVSGTVALMLQANPSLTPNLVKAILQYTAELKPDVHPLRQGGGFLNTKGAVELSRFFATAAAGDRYPKGKGWSRKINWGNHRVSRGAISPSGNAWALNIVWGTAVDDEGDNIVWGTTCDTDECFNIVWGTAVDDEGDNIVWGTVDDEGDNIVWGTTVTTDDEGDNIVWGTVDDEGDNIVWGTDCGGDDCYNIVWGTATTDDEGDNIVWGTAADDEGDNIVWGTTDDEGDNIVWGTNNDEGDNIVWGTSAEDGTLFDDTTGDTVDWESLFDPPPGDSAGETSSIVEAL